MMYVLLNGYYTRTYSYFRVILSILSRAEERIVKSQDISGHLKRLIDFTIESKKLLNVLHHFLEEFLPFP